MCICYDIIYNIYIYYLNSFTKWGPHPQATGGARLDFEPIKNMSPAMMKRNINKKGVLN